MKYTEDQMTEWFPPEVKPKRKGIYERDYGLYFGIYYCYWNGKCFSCGGLNMDDAMLWRNDDSLKHHLRWRGLKEQAIQNRRKANSQATLDSSSKVK